MDSQKNSVDHKNCLKESNENQRQKISFLNNMVS